MPERCHHEDSGRRCHKFAGAGQTHCREHRESGNEETMAEEKSNLTPGQQAQEAALAAAGLAKAERPAAPAARPKFAAPTQGQQANDMAIQLYARQKAEALQRKKDRDSRRKRDGRRPRAPLVALPQLPELPDPLAMETDGKPWGTPGWYKRWIATVGPDGKPSNLPMRRFVSMGGRPITRGQAGLEENPDEPMRDYNMLAMECPMENWGAHVLRSAPPGLYDDEWEIEELETMLDAERSRHGKSVPQLVVGEGHGERSPLP